MKVASYPGALSSGKVLFPDNDVPGYEARMKATELSKIRNGLSFESQCCLQTQTADPVK